MDEGMILILWFGFVLLMMQYFQFERTELVLGVPKTRYSMEAALIVMVPVIVLAGMRSFSYADTWAYVSTFQKMPDSFSGIPAYMQTVTKDKGFALFSCVIRAVAGNAPRVYLFVIAILQGAALLVAFRKFSRNFLLSIFLFVASTDYVSWMYNGIRQFLAAALIFSATELMLEKKYIKTIAVIGLASLFHGTAWMMLPVMLFIQGPAWNKKTILFAVGSILALGVADQFTNVLDNLLVDTQYTNVVSDWESFQDDGTNILRVMVYSIPMLLSVIGLRFIREADDPVINMATNASIISTGIYLISSVTSGIYVGRLPIYVSLYGYILLPWELEHCFTKKSQRLIYAVMILCYLAFNRYAMYNWGATAA